MIFKVGVANSVNEPMQGWRWIDRVADAQTFGQLTVPRNDPLSWASRVEGRMDAGERDLAMFSEHSELVRVVDAMWGPSSVRQFAEEIWPEFYSAPEAGGCDPVTVTCVRLVRRDGTAVLALFATEAFLLDDSGDTIERLR